MTSDLQLSFPNQREPQKQGDFPLWERKLLFLPRICNIFLAGYIYPQAAWLQEPDAGLNGCAASAQHPGSCKQQVHLHGAQSRSLDGGSPGINSNLRHTKKLCMVSKTRGSDWEKCIACPVLQVQILPNDLMLFTGQKSKPVLRFLPVEWGKKNQKTSTQKCAVSCHSSERGKQRWRALGLPPIWA